MNRNSFEEEINISQEINMILNIANKLRGPYKPEAYKDVIIPMTIIRRFECALEETKQDVIDTYKKDKETPRQILCNLSKYDFYNTSDYNLKKLLDEQDLIADNFREYIKGFSDNIISILENLDFDKQITKLNNTKRLFGVIQEFSEIDLSPKTVDNIKMGYIFEDLIRRFSENANAGDHYTGRDIIKLMVSLLLAEGCDDIYDENKVITILDQAAGTGGMLSTSSNHIHSFNESADIRLFAQENNPESYAMCLAEMLIRGQPADNIRLADTMVEDCFKNIKMRFVIENPPFGMKWGGKDAPDGVEDAVKKEHKKDNSRFPAGLPGTGDMQMLFLQSAIDKLDEKKGRCAIIENGSPLFKGGTSSGESQIRRWILEEDLLEAIIQLSEDQFYNTNITTYIWIISKNKRKEREGKVQLIDASSMYEDLRKSLGKKRKKISSKNRETITKLYNNFEENEYSKIFNNEEFLYKEYSVYQPLQRSYGITEERIKNLIMKKSLKSIYDQDKVTKLKQKETELTSKEEEQLEKNCNQKPLYDKILKILKENISDEIFLSKKEFNKYLKEIFDNNLEKKHLNNISKGLSIMDKNAEIETKKKGTTSDIWDENTGILYDKETKDTEIVKLSENIDEYMKQEVLPYLPDAKAFFEENMTKKNPSIKTGAEINFKKYFYTYTPPRDLEEIEKDIEQITQEIRQLIGDI